MAAVHLLIVLFFSAVFPAAPQPTVTADALLRFKNSFTNANHSLTNWKLADGLDPDPCSPNHTWVGVACTADMVVSLNLANMGLEGKPDVAALEPLDDLRAISLENNSLSGPIPEFNRLRRLKAVYASKNRFSGEIPADYFEPMDSLKKLWLSHNQFSGYIPTSVGELPKLKELHLEHNEFSGPIPDFQDVDTLKVLDLSNNKLDGPIPDYMDKFDVKVFENNNDLCGSKVSKPCPYLASLSHVKGTSLLTKWIVMCLVIGLLVLSIIIKANSSDEEEGFFGKKNEVDHEAAMAASASKRGSSSGRKAV